MKKKIKKFVKKALKKSTFTISLIPPPKFKEGDIVSMSSLPNEPFVVNMVISYPNREVDNWCYCLLSGDKRYWDREKNISLFKGKND